MCFLWLWGLLLLNACACLGVCVCMFSMCVCVCAGTSPGRRVCFTLMLSEEWRVLGFMFPWRRPTSQWRAVRRRSGHLWGTALIYFRPLLVSLLLNPQIEMTRLSFSIGWSHPVSRWRPSSPHLYPRPRPPRIRVRPASPGGRLCCRHTNKRKCQAIWKSLWHLVITY